MRLGEPARDVRRVVADGGDVNAVALETVDGILQLDELRAAVGSPIRAAEKDQQQPFRPDQLMQRPLLAVLVGQGEVGNFFADLGPGLGVVVGGGNVLLDHCRVDFPARGSLLYEFAEDVIGRSRVHLGSALICGSSDGRAPTIGSGGGGSSDRGPGRYRSGKDTQADTERACARSSMDAKLVSQRHVACLLRPDCEVIGYIEAGPRRYC